MEFFISEYGRLIIFFHVISAVIWVGAMIGIRVAVHPSLQKISDPMIRIPRSLEVMKRLFLFMIPVVFLLLLTALLLIVGFDFKHSAPELYPVVLAKEAIWTVMTVNLIMMLVRRKKAEKAFYLQQNDLLAKNLTLITKYMLPANILLGIVAIYLGVVLRGF